MAWLVLVASGVLEAVWATAMDRSDGFSRLLPSLIFAVSLLFSMAGLAFAMRSLPTGPATRSGSASERCSLWVTRC
jgi:quaternary ammonium compound-resistance protein SugE